MLEIVCPQSVKTLGKGFEKGQLPSLLSVLKKYLDMDGWHQNVMFMDGVQYELCNARTLMLTAKL